MPSPEPPGTTRVFPIRLQIGDKFSDESGEWEVIARMRRLVERVRVQRADKPGVTEARTWPGSSPGGSDDPVSTMGSSRGSVVPMVIRFEKVIGTA